MKQTTPNPLSVPFPPSTPPKPPAQPIQPAHVGLLSSPLPPPHRTTPLWSSRLGGWCEHLSGELNHQWRREGVEHLRQQDPWARADQECHIVARQEGEVDVVRPHAGRPLPRVRHVDRPLLVLGEEPSARVGDHLLLVLDRPARHLLHVVGHHLLDPPLDLPHHEAVAEYGAVQEVGQRAAGRTDVVVRPRVSRREDHVHPLKAHNVHVVEVDVSDLELGHSSVPEESPEVVGVVDQDLLRVVDFAEADRLSVPHHCQPDLQLWPAAEMSEYCSSRV
jgi:hypothetical protein